MTTLTITEDPFLKRTPAMLQIGDIVYNPAIGYCLVVPNQIDNATITLVNLCDGRFRENINHLTFTVFPKATLKLSI